MLLSGRAPSAAAAETAVPILVYHRFGPVVADGMTVRTTVFEEQINWLRTHGYHVVPLRAVVDSLRNRAAPLPHHAIAITVDDGHKSVYSDLLPIVRRERIPVTLFIYPSAISNANYAMTWNELAELARTGLVDIESHTYWHPNFNHERARLAPDAYRAFVMTQLTRSKDIIAQRIGRPVDMLAWPFGIHDAELERWAADAGYRAGFTLERAPASRQSNLMALPRYLIVDADRGARFAAIVENAAGRNGS
jgi:peptidoglycan/xylan/chitin deacetylase (PgdA/CDA1 family)